MPLTFPSHAAAVWPLHRAAPRLLPAAALVVGSCTPDMAYLLNGNGVFTHSFAGTLLFCLPAGLMALAWLDLVSPTVSSVLPAGLEEPLKGEAFPRTVVESLRTVLALWLGALTHVLWDGFTHRTRW